MQILKIRSSLFWWKSCPMAGLSYHVIWRKCCSMACRSHHIMLRDSSFEVLFLESLLKELFGVADCWRDVLKLGFGLTQTGATFFHEATFLTIIVLSIRPTSIPDLFSVGWRQLMFSLLTVSQEWDLLHCRNEYHEGNQAIVANDEAWGQTHIENLINQGGNLDTILQICVSQSRFDTFCVTALSRQAKLYPKRYTLVNSAVKRQLSQSQWHATALQSTSLPRGTLL